MDMWDTHQIRTQVENGCCRGDMAAKLPAVAVSRSYFAFLNRNCGCCRETVGASRQVGMTGLSLHRPAPRIPEGVIAQPFAPQFWPSHARRPVLVQAGLVQHRRFAARHADAGFTAQMAKARAQVFYADLNRLAAAEGRLPGAARNRDDRR
jgi:hypothetical protein